VVRSELEALEKRLTAALQDQRAGGEAVEARLLGEVSNAVSEQSRHFEAEVQQLSKRLGQAAFAQEVEQIAASLFERVKIVEVFFSILIPRVV
jgi:hypothetical protein